MDYELKIRQLEGELLHLRELLATAGYRLDAHDLSFEAAAKRFGEIGALFENVAAGMQALQAAQLVTEQKLQGLIDTLAREHGNGSQR